MTQIIIIDFIFFGFLFWTNFQMILMSHISILNQFSNDIDESYL